MIPIEGYIVIVEFGDSQIRHYFPLSDKRRVMDCFYAEKQKDRKVYLVQSTILSESTPQEKPNAVDA